MIFIKRKLTKQEVSRVKSILSKYERNNINLDIIEAVSNKTGSAIFALFNRYRGREPYNEYFLLIKKKIYFIEAETFWNVKKENEINYLNARFHNNDDPSGYEQLVSTSIQKTTIEFSSIANDALHSLTDGRNRFYFKYIGTFRQNLGLVP